MKASPKIIHEDDSIIIIVKPAGMPSTSLSSDETETLASWLLKKFPALAKIEKGALEAGLVHRLDNDTSGVIVAAKNQNAYAKLRCEFDSEKVEKEYLAIVVGSPPLSGAIEAPIAHNPRKKKKMIVVTKPSEARELKARAARTIFSVKKKNNAAGLALLTVGIKTGVRHQIRAHLAAAGFPIAGDRLYQNSKERVLDRSNAARHLLHASRIKFKHPRTGRPVSFSSPMPNDMKEALGVL